MDCSWTVDFSREMSTSGSIINNILRVDWWTFSSIRPVIKVQTFVTWTTWIGGIRLTDRNQISLTLPPLNTLSFIFSRVLIINKQPCKNTVLINYLTVTSRLWFARLFLQHILRVVVSINHNLMYLRYVYHVPLCKDIFLY